MVNYSDEETVVIDRSDAYIEVSDENEKSDRKSEKQGGERQIHFEGKRHVGRSHQPLPKQEIQKFLLRYL